VGTTSGSAFRISLVDDDRSTRQALATMLVEFGFQIDQFDGAPPFLSAHKTLVPDLILLDVEMPMMNGYELCRHLKKNPAWAPVPVPVLFLSGLTQQRDKLEASDAILLKPGKLTTDEFRLIQQHTAIGAQTLAQVCQLYPHNHFIAMGIEIAKSHHERWDGRGYPDGLVGTSIPLSVRIVSLADVYDALRSERCYKAALPQTEALAQVIQGAGTQFDPILARLFLENEARLAQVRDRFAT
jgi:response regulator RpfG family c-di-GMP phosphodiesterase